MNVDESRSAGDPARVLVTGATGLIGRHVARRFREAGWSVRALTRPVSRDRLRGLECEPREGDIEDPASLRGAAEGCAVVVHAAARLGSPASWERYLATNVRGTRNVAAEARRAGVRRFVHISTVAVYGRPADHSALPIDERSPTDLPIRGDDHYERSKRLAEEEVRAVPPPFEWSMLRPDVVVGEGDRHFTPRIVEAARRRLLPLPADGDNDLPLVYAGNLADAVWLAATRPEAAGRVYNVTDDGRLTLRELLVAAADGPAPRFLRVPPAAFLAAARILEAAFALLPSRRRPPLNRRNVWFLTHPDPFSDRRIRAELGWKPRIDTAEAWRRSVAWQRGS